MLPLENIKILDFTQLPPGQFCAMMLGDMGAAVIRVEQPPKTSSPEVGGMAAKWEELLGGTYRGFNRNKKSIILNLRDEEARQILYELAKGTDVIVEGFRPGVTRRLGIDYETLGGINPRLIYCSMSGYGQTGPYKDMPGHDINYVAMGGALQMFGSPPPVIPNFIADYAGATLHSVIGILLALVARDKTGKGQQVDIAYTDGVVSLMTQFACGYLATGDPAAAKAQLGMLVSNAGYGVYQTKDGKYISLGCVEPWFWQNLCLALGRKEFIPEFANWDRQQEIRGCFAETLLTRTRDEWFEQFKDRNIAVGKVYDVDEVFRDPQVLHRQMLVEVEDSSGAREKHIGIPIKLSDTPGMIRSTAPTPGEHTRQILLEMGYTEGEIKRLCQKGTISLPGRE